MKFLAVILLQVVFSGCGANIEGNLASKLSSKSASMGDGNAVLGGEPLTSGNDIQIPNWLRNHAGDRAAFCTLYCNSFEGTCSNNSTYRIECETALSAHFGEI